MNITPKYFGIVPVTGGYSLVKIRSGVIDTVVHKTIKAASAAWADSETRALEWEKNRAPEVKSEVKGKTPVTEEPIGHAIVRRKMANGEYGLFRGREERPFMTFKNEGECKVQYLKLVYQG